MTERTPTHYPRKPIGVGAWIPTGAESYSVARVPLSEFSPAIDAIKWLKAMSPNILIRIIHALEQRGPNVAVQHML